MDNLGQIASVTDETGSKTCYTYDAMGRMASITYPSETQAGVCDESAWQQQVFVFVPVASDEHGLPAGHWRMHRRVGNRHVNTYYDALWRPALEESLDYADIANTLSQVVKRYDADGRLTFQSYPLRGIGNLSTATQGVWTGYDALGRVTSVSQDSELAAPNNVLTTLTEYLPGFKTRVTNPRGQQTLTIYQVFDQPTYDFPAGIDHPEGASTEIYRDVFGKVTALRRRNANASEQVWRRYVYDISQQLCKSIEPETGATVYDYDPAGNLSWSASGVSNLSDPQACNRTEAWASGRVVSRTHDTRNRVKTLVFPDGKGNTTHSYTPDGQLASLVVDNDGTNVVTTAYTYNRRRLMTEERMTWGSLNRAIGYAYTPLGHLASQTYPNGQTVAYAPNALGQPTQAGPYATGIQYYPNGGMKQFTYGNGIVHTQVQNARQLPSRSTDSGSGSTPLDLGYSYDSHANVASITDYTSGARQSRTLSYDGLDRLTQAVGASFGTASYGYNTLDNLTTLKVTAGSGVRDQVYHYDASNRLTSVTHTVGGATVVGLGYDVQGNLANKNGRAYTFDFGNRLRAVGASGSSPASGYVFDGHGRRVRDYTTASKYSSYSADGKLMYATDGRLNVATQYVYLNGSLVAYRESPASGTVIKYQHTDALGTPIAVTDASRAIVETSEYEPYGQLSNRALTDGPGYTGHVQDAATGLTYMQQRYYDPGIGRFLSVDPVTAYSSPGANFNRYWYANNNPYKFKDPDGRKSKSQACGDGIYCGPDPKYRGLPNGEQPNGPFEPGKTQGEVNQNGKVQRNDAVNSSVKTLRAAMDMKGHKATPLIVTGGESYVASDGKVRSVTDGDVISNRKQNSAHNVENGSRAIDLRAITMSHNEFMGIVREFTDFKNNTNDYGDMHEHLGLPNKPGFSCSASVCTEP